MMKVVLLDLQDLNLQVFAKRYWSPQLFTIGPPSGPPPSTKFPKAIIVEKSVHFAEDNDSSEEESSEEEEDEESNDEGRTN